MHPVLFSMEAFDLFGFQLGPFEVHSYGLLAAVGFILGTWISVRLSFKENLDPGHALDLAFWCLMGGLIGSRVLYSIVNIRDYWNACFDPSLPNALNRGLPLDEANCWAIFRVWEGGLVWYGGLIGALAATYILVRLRKLNFFQMTDIGLTAVPIGHAFGRLGCLAAGCCHGRITDSPLGIHFPPDSIPYTGRMAAEQAGALAASFTLPIHPTQLYESVGELVIFGILLLVRRRRRFFGQVSLTFLMLYSVMRFTVENFRGDQVRGFLFSWQEKGVLDGIPYTYTSGISTSQVVSILMAAACLATLFVILKKRRETGE